VLDLLIQDGKCEIIRLVILSCRYVTDMRVTPYRTAFGLDKNLKDCLDISWIFRQLCGGAGREIVEINHAVRELAAKLINPGHEGFKVVPILDPRRFSDLLDSFAFNVDQVSPEDGIVVKRGKLGSRILHQQVDELVNIHTGFFHHFLRYFCHLSSPFFGRVGIIILLLKNMAHGIRFVPNSR
jgi:hypothetical protein